MYSHEDVAYFLPPTTPSLQGERRSDEKLCLRELVKVPMPCIAVDDACYVSALLLMPLLVPCHLAFAWPLFALPCLTLFFRVWFLPYLLPCSQLPCSQGFCVLLSALSSGLLSFALSAAVLTGFLCSAMCPIF
ncbi:hypothetical protein ACE6H2_026947 [Prunus campanulata]